MYKKIAIIMMIATVFFLTGCTKKTANTSADTANIDSDTVIQEDSDTINKNDNENVNTEVTKPVEHDDADDPSVAYGADGKLRISFVSPEGNTFEKGQARKWQVKVENLDSAPGSDYICDWTFQLNGAKYEEMLENKTCAFTSTFIEAKGSLVVKAEFKRRQGRSVFDESGAMSEYVRDVVETLVVTRSFEVD